MAINRSNLDKRAAHRAGRADVGGDRFDKAFAVYLSGPQGVSHGVGRSITDDGMFIEVREPCPLGTRLTVTFCAPDTGTEVTLIAEVRYQCFINYGMAQPGEGRPTRGGMRGVGVRFVGFDVKAGGQNGEMQ